MDQNIFRASSFQSRDEGTSWHIPIENRQEEHMIDLNEQLVRNKPATFFMRVNSNAMIGAGIHAGDVVIVDRSLEPRNGKVIIALLDGEMLIRRLDVQNHKKRLLPATNTLSPIEISESSKFSIWGVVTYVIHSV